MALLEATDLRLGCQSWTEPDWQGVFYPPAVTGSDRLSAYAGAFDFVEIDSTFYATPRPPTVLSWYENTPEGFAFAAKVPQSITHDPDPKTRMPRRPLESEGWQDRLTDFVETIGLLEEKLVALLVQLPPQWHWRPERLSVLETFVGALRADIHWAVEFRHRGWLNEQVMDLLRQRGITLVSQDLYYMPKRIEVTSTELAYIRLQGRRKEISEMDRVQIEKDQELDFWAGAVQDLVAQKLKRVIVAANNHYQGFSPGTVAALQRRLGLPEATMPAGRMDRLV